MQPAYPRHFLFHLCVQPMHAKRQHNPNSSPRPARWSGRREAHQSMQRKQRHGAAQPPPRASLRSVPPAAGAPPPAKRNRQTLTKGLCKPGSRPLQPAIRQAGWRMEMVAAARLGIVARELLKVQLAILCLLVCMCSAATRPPAVNGRQQHYLPTFPGTCPTAHPRAQTARRPRRPPRVAPCP